jgi:Nucleotidyl transferase AbiEii toxin, Type IV TA system
MTARAYATPEAFKQALEQRLRTGAQTGPRLRRSRQLLVFERFLARIAAVFGDAATLKGGLALELRIKRARATKDVDLRVMGSAEELLTKLQAAGRLDLSDFMTFEVLPDAEHPELLNDGLKYDGLRFRVEGKLAGKIYGEPFGTDVVLGEPLFGEPELVTADDLLAFAGLAPPTLRIYPIETHIAEKLHAYTMPRARPNTRVKDLPDLALLATAQPISAQRLRSALAQTFAFRNTHSLPARLPEPLTLWTTPYAAMARENQLAWLTLPDVTEAARQFIDPVLAAGLDATWEPQHWRWELR